VALHLHGLLPVVVDPAVVREMAVAVEDEDVGVQTGVKRAGDILGRIILGRIDQVWKSWPFSRQRARSRSGRSSG
jgi:hypothetical protein